MGVNNDSGFLGVSKSPEARRRRRLTSEAEDGSEGGGGGGGGDHLDRRERCAVNAPSSSAPGSPGSPSNQKSRAQRDIEQQALHVSLVRRAQQLDLADMALARAICVGGRDFVGRRVVTIVAAHLEPVLRAGDEQRMLLHAAAELAPVVAAPGGYALVYFHAGGVFAAPPSLQFVRQLHAALGPRHKENLKMFYVVHPTAMLKAGGKGRESF